MSPNTLVNLKPPAIMLLIFKLFISSLILWVNASSAAGLLTPTNQSLPALTLQEHHVEVIIEDAYAITRIEQVFHNPHAQDLEAIYSFPVPAHGAVSEFTLWIDGRPVSGEVLETATARQIYAEEKQAGREAGITEKNGYQTIEITVSPVRAGQDTRIRLVYFQPAHIDTGIGRYVYPLEEGGTDEQQLAFWTADDNVMRAFSFTLRIKSAYPISGVRVPTFNSANIQQISAGEWLVNIQSSNTNPSTTSTDENPTLPSNLPTTPSNHRAPVFNLNQDILVYWRHAQGLPGSVDLISYKPENQERGTFMLVITPGDDLKPITQGSDWIFVLDISGSMQGKYATLAHGISQALGKLRVNDRFRIILFNDQVQELTNGYVVASPKKIQYYSDEVTNVQPGSGTNLFAGIKAGLASIEDDRTSTIVLVTDGVANVEETRQRTFIDLVKSKDIRLFTFIMGNSSNLPLLEAVATHSGGFATTISTSDDIVGQLLSATSKVTHEALHGIKVNIDGVKVADINPPTLHSLYRGQQLVLFGHYWGSGPATINIEGQISGQPKSYTTSFDFPDIATDNPEIERLWAYASIEYMTQEITDFGEKPDIKQAIVDLAIAYSLVTDYTSMVVLRNEVFAQRGIQRNNQQRLAIESNAQQQRHQAPAQNRRVDDQTPMFTNNRPSFGSSSGGAMGASLLLLCLPLLRRLLRKRNN